jgi:Mn2+/Fe2+ NRAMP family transporter
MTSTQSFDPYALPKDATADPPPSLWTALLRIGPGIILAASIVGSGELILTTSLGARHGFIFLWLVIFSCIVKVFVQIELGRYAISSGQPTLGFLNELGGPRLGANWLVWWWFAMLMATVFQLGAMCGGVGQAIHLAITAMRPGESAPVADAPTWFGARPEIPWAVATAAAAIGLLISGGYRRIETVATLLVISITVLTVAGVAALQWTEFAIRPADLASGFTWDFLRIADNKAIALAAAFACFGITGVGASELYAYPYWCLEKGYARFTGPRDDSESWVRRARGWIRVMQLDAWVSMLVFTAATVSFYFMGAAVLHRRGLVPEKTDMVKTLSEMYSLTFGRWTYAIFLIGAAAVLFKTMYVASAGHARLTADLLGLANLVHNRDARARAVWIRRFCVFYPTMAIVLFLLFGDPVAMVVVGGVAQALTLPIISGATVFLRFCRLDGRLRPHWLTDVCLCLAFLSITLVALYASWDGLANKIPGLFATEAAR